MAPIIITSIVLTIIDQISKIVVVNLLDTNNNIQLIKNFFYLTYAQNNGAAFSILTGQRILLILITLLIIGMLIYYLKKNFNQDKLNKIAFSLVIGGSIGNLIDRIVRGYVVDFIDFKIFGYNFPIFNLADTFITIGVIILIIIAFRKEDTNDNR